MSRRITEIVNGAITLRAVHDGDHTWGDYNAIGAAETRYMFTNKIDTGRRRLPSRRRSDLVSFR